MSKPLTGEKRFRSRLDGEYLFSHSNGKFYVEKNDSRSSKAKLVQSEENNGTLKRVEIPPPNLDSFIGQLPEKRNRFTSIKQLGTEKKSTFANEEFQFWKRTIQNKMKMIEQQGCKEWSMGSTIKIKHVNEETQTFDLQCRIVSTESGSK